MTARDADAVRSALGHFDRCFAAGDGSALADCFTDDAQLLLVHRDAIEGRLAILAHWTTLFAAFDTSAWRTELRLLDAHEDTATTFSVYSETLIDRAGGPSRTVHGRLARFWRFDGDAWRAALVMNSHIRPVELVTSPAGLDVQHGGVP